MRKDKKPVDETRAESESSDKEDACEMTSKNIPPRGNSSSPPLSSGGEAQEIDGIDTGRDSIGVFIPAKVNKEKKELPPSEPEKYDKFDREAFLQEYAELSNIEGEPRIIQDLPELRFSYPHRGEKTSKFPKISKYEKMTPEDRQKALVDDLRETLKAVPDTLMYFSMGYLRQGDCGRASDQKPDWLDMEKFRRGQKFAENNMFSILYSELISLLPLYTFDDGMKPIIITGNSTTPYAAYKRYLSTVVRFRHLYTQDSWNKETAAWRDIMVIRSMHNAVRKKMQSITNEEIDEATTIQNAWCPTREILLEDFSESVEAPAIGQCPYVVGRNNSKRPRGISQTEMSVTQWSQVGLIITYPEKFGVHNATDEDLDAFCHLWRSIGYQLGIEEEYNFCRGTLEEIRQRGRDFVESWVKPNFREITPEWEHVTRSIVTGTAAVVPFLTYEGALLHTMDILGLKMPRFYASLSYKNWIKHNLLSSMFDYGTRLPGVVRLINAIANMQITQYEKSTPAKLESMRVKFPDYNANRSGSKGKSLTEKYIVRDSSAIEISS